MAVGMLWLTLAIDPEEKDDYPELEEAIDFAGPPLPQ